MNNAHGLGVALFNDPNPFNTKNLTGVYCVAGKEPVRFIDKTSLPTHIRWLTNLDSDTIKASSNILPTHFATTTVDQLKKELGLSKMPLEHQVYLLSIALDNVTKLTQKLYGNTTGQTTALHDMMPSELRNVNPRAQPEFKAILTRASTTHHTLDAKFHSESSLLSLVLPRFHQAHNMLKDGLPLCEWVKMDAKEMGPKPKRMDWVLSEVRPTISLVRIKRVTPALQGVVEAAFNEPLLAGGSHQCVYVTAPEIVFLSKVAEVTIEEIYIASQRLSTKIKLPLTDPLAQMSWAYGMVCENYCNALRKGKNGQNKRTFHSFWMQAQDRLHCLEKVVALVALGYAIRSFGMGRIQIALEPHMQHRFYRDCVELAIPPPMTQDSVDIQIPPNYSSADLTVQLFLQSNAQHLFALDRQLIDRDTLIQ